MFKDYKILGTVALLSIIGLLLIYSAGGTTYFFRQLIWLPISIGGLIIVYNLPRRLFFHYAYLIYFLTIGLLILVLFFGTGIGTKRWFSFSPLSINFQPSEFAKIGIILGLSRLLTERPRLDFIFGDLLLPVLLTILPIVLILLEPDLGTGFIILPLLVTLLYWKGLRPFHIFLLFSPLLSLIFSFNLYTWIGYFLFLILFLLLKTHLLQSVVTLLINSSFGLLTPLVWSHLKDYQQARIISFLSPWLDPKGISWNLIQSLIAVGSGRIWGRGFLAGTQKRLEFLPNRHTDFIFSCLGEEFGFIGCLVVVFLFTFLLYQFLLTAHSQRGIGGDEFSSFCALGFTTVLFFQIFVNIGMVLGLLPITGIPLPFLSYGGSSLFVNFLIVGFILNFRRREY